MAHIERYANRPGDHRFRVVASNGRILSGSSEGYHQEDDRERCVALTLTALIKDRGTEGMRQLGWRATKGDPSQSLLDELRAGAATTEEALQLHAALLQELYIPSPPMITLLAAAEVGVADYEQLGERPRFEAVRAALTATYRQAGRQRPGDVFVRDRALRAYWILTGREDTRE